MSPRNRLSSGSLSILALLCFFALWLPAAAGAQVHFQTWFPQYRDNFEGIIRDNCSTEVELYWYGGPEPASCAGRPAVSCFAGDAINCLLTHCRQSVAANMASAGVLLGVLPTTLGLLGTSTVEIGLLWARRPLLASILAAGSPSVSPIRTIDYRGPGEVLHHGFRGGRATQVLAGGGGFSPWSTALVLTCEYALPLAAVANVAHVSYQLCVQTVCSFDPPTALHPALWAALSLLLHAFGVWAVFLRVHLDWRGAADDTGAGTGASRQASPCGSWCLRWPLCARCWHPWYRREFRLSARQPRATLRVRKDGDLFVLVAWATATGTVLHIIYGTLVFSSILFISAGDAIGVVTRYLASMLVCRAILMLEINGLRNVIHVVPDGGVASEGKDKEPEQPSAEAVESIGLVEISAEHNVRSGV